jgi:hypothetical protein
VPRHTRFEVFVGYLALLLELTVGVDQINRSPFKLAWPSLPTMMRSCTAIPSGRHRDNRLRHLDVGARRRRIAPWVVVHEPTAQVTSVIRLHFSRLQRLSFSQSNFVR